MRQLTGRQTSERNPLVGERDDMGELTDKIGGKLGSFDRCFHLPANFSFSSQTFGKILKHSYQHSNIEVWKQKLRRAQIKRKKESKIR